MIKLLYIDLFCGAGGISTGVENARHNGNKCAKVIACVNHDKNAIASHAENHPDTLHFTEDIRTLELSPLLAHIEKMKLLYPQAKWDKFEHCFFVSLRRKGWRATVPLLLLTLGLTAIIFLQRFEINTLKNDITEKREIIQACLELTERQLQLKK